MLVFGGVISNITSEHRQFKKDIWSSKPLIFRPKLGSLRFREGKVNVIYHMRSHPTSPRHGVEQRWLNGSIFDFWKTKAKTTYLVLGPAQILQEWQKTQWFCPQGPWEDTPNFPFHPHNSKGIPKHKLLVKHPGAHLPGGPCGWDLRKTLY